jgi:hypothetical protein
VLAMRRAVGVRRRAPDDAAGDCRRSAHAGCRDARPRIAVAVADNTRAATEAHLDEDRWMNDGGGFASEADATVRAGTGRR